MSVLERSPNDPPLAQIIGLARDDPIGLRPGPTAAHQSVTFAEVDLRLLQPGRSWRAGALDESHLGRLMETPSRWSAVLVHQASMTVVDGCHRLEAARRLGRRALEARLLSCSEGFARLVALQANLQHGLPLTLQERREAAIDVFIDNPSWSDSRVAQLCGLSRRTVANLRRSRPDQETADVPATAAPLLRVGRDGRSYPIKPEVVRERIIAELAEKTKDSLRTIALRTGSSPETVRRVRRNLAQADLPATPPGWPPQGLLPASLGEPPATLTEDSACNSTEAGRAFARWFDSLAVDHSDLSANVKAVPLNRVYIIIDEAERRAELWKLFADQLRARVNR